jgi:hypothetical protein
VPTTTEAMSQSADSEQPTDDDRDPGRGGTPPAGFIALAPVRLSLVPPGTGPSRIDGTWWPYSGDLAGELSSLLTELDCQWGRVTRVTVNRSAWPHIPPRMHFAGRVVHLGYFGTDQGPQTICLICPGLGRWDLTVVPSGSAVTETELLMVSTLWAPNPHTPEA